VTSGLRIAEVARRSGFTPATIRYYEDIGLLPAPPRTPSGYRIYDAATLDRLAFIARAKRLGCTLQEVADLVVAWDGGRCGPVQDRLRTLLTAKRAEAQARVAELVALTADLQRAAAQLERHRPDGPCDDRCGCLVDADAAPMVTAVGLVAAPSARRAPAANAGPASSATPAIACTLESAAVPGRLTDWQRLLGHVTGRHPIDGGVRLALDAATPLQELADLAAAEHGCCRFFAFAITVDERGLGLEVTAPAEARDLVAAMFGAA
jgi:MerR family copper efflux transcriptional regulator